MSTDTRVPAVYFEAKPKRGRQDDVDNMIFELTALYAEIYDHKANCWLRPTRGSWGQWKVLITFESEPVQNMLTLDLRFQELLSSLRANCKPANRLRRLLLPLWFRHRGLLIPDFQGPFFSPEQPRPSD